MRKRQRLLLFAFFTAHNNDTEWDMTLRCCGALLFVTRRGLGRHGFRCPKIGRLLVPASCSVRSTNPPRASRLLSAGPVIVMFGGHLDLVSRPVELANALDTVVDR